MNVRKIVKHLEIEVPIDGKPRRIREAIEQVLINYAKMPEIQALEKATDLEDSVISFISNNSPIQNKHAFLC